MATAILPSVQRRITAACKAQIKKGFKIVHTWGVQRSYGEPASSSNGTWAPNPGNECCPMGAVILHYDQVDDITNHERAAAKILKTSTENVNAFINGFDADEDTLKDGLKNLKDNLDPDDRGKYPMLAKWFRLGWAWGARYPDKD